MSMISRRKFITSGLMACAAPIIPDIYSQGKPYRHSLVREFGEYSHSGVKWKKLRDGLYFTRIEIYNDGKPADSAALVLAEHEHNYFSVHHDSRLLRLKNIEQWQEWTDDGPLDDGIFYYDVMFNSSYYMYRTDKEGGILSAEPATRIIIGGRQYGGFVKSKPCGMLLSEPKDDKPPYTYLADLTNESTDYSRYLGGVQSWPMLVDINGDIRVGKSNWYANRTAVCSDRNENIIVMTTEGGFFSLHELGRFLKQSKLGIRKAMNMDGGYEAELAVKCGAVNYATYGQWETQGRRDISVPGIKIGLPAVVGISKRKQK